MVVAEIGRHRPHRELGLRLNLGSRAGLRLAHYDPALSALSKGYEGLPGQSSTAGWLLPTSR